MNPSRTSSADRKDRFGGLLENPWVSRFQRDLMDYGRIPGLRAALSAVPYISILDVGCGLGEAAALARGFYLGLDDSWPRVRYAAHHHKGLFVRGDAAHLPCADRSFDLVLLVDTSHHCTDDVLLTVLAEMKRVSRRFLLVSDPVLTPRIKGIRKWCYDMDRGGCFRSPEELKSLFRQQGLAVHQETYFWTRPRLYEHGVYILVEAAGHSPGT